MVWPVSAIALVMAFKEQDFEVISILQYLLPCELKNGLLPIKIAMFFEFVIKLDNNLQEMFDFYLLIFSIL